MKYNVFVLMLVSSLSYAAGWSNEATPTRVDIERGNGFMVFGNFANPGNCTVADAFYVQNTHPMYKEIYSTVLSAFMSGKKIKVYISLCEANAWYAAPTTTYNTMTTANGALILTH